VRGRLDNVNVHLIGIGRRHGQTVGRHKESTGAHAWIDGANSTISAFVMGPIFSRHGFPRYGSAGLGHIAPPPAADGFTQGGVVVVGMVDMT
jgi:hypothetical protein